MRELGFATRKMDALRLAGELGGSVHRVADRRGWVIREERHCNECGTQLEYVGLRDGDFCWVHPFTRLMRCSDERETATKTN